MMVGRNFFLFIALSLIAISNLKANEGEEQWKKEWLEEEAAYKKYNPHLRSIINSFQEKMKVELGLKATGEGGALYKEIEEVYIKFEVFRRASIEEARALLLYAMNSLQEMLNTRKDIQPFLAERPFPNRRINLSIGFEGVNGVYSDGSVAFAYTSREDVEAESRSMITYCYRSPTLKSPLRDIFCEPIQDAVEKAKETALVFPFKHQNTPFEIAIDEMLLEFSSKVWIERGLECRSIGGKLENRIDEVGGVFYLFHPATQDQAREVAVYIAETLLEMLNQNEKIRPYLNPYPFPSDKLKLELEFTDSKYTHYRGSLEKIILDEDQLSYFQIFWTKYGTGESECCVISSELIDREPYEKSLEIVKLTPFSLLKEIHNMFECGFRWIFIPKKPNS